VYLVAAVFYLLAFILLLSVVIFLLPGLIVFLLAGYYVQRKTGWRMVEAVKGLKRFKGSSINSVGVLFSLSLVTGFSLGFMYEALMLITSGVQMMSNILVFLLFSCAAGACAYLIHLIAEGKLMRNIFSVIAPAEQAKLDQFFDDRPAPMVEINPVTFAEALKREVIGQDEIVEEVASLLGRRTKMRRANKPLAVMMFVGATGAGKTELAKAIASAAFSNRLIRLDMNEFTDASSVTRLIGSAPGYIGSEAGGQLTREVMRLKNGVILFDEIEKAHADLHKVLMSLLDEGRLTEQSSGRVADASGFVIVLTSNAEHAKLASLADKIPDRVERKRAVKDTLQTIFKPEQLARLDDVMLFKKVARRDMAQIIGKFLFKFADEAEVDLVQADAELLIQLIERHEKMSDYGIRELVRLVEHRVVDGMLEAKNAGFDAVAIKVDGEEVLVTGERMAGKGRR